MRAMNIRMHRFAVVVPIAGMFACLPVHADWPAFGGPDGNNVARADDLATTWPEGGPAELWTVSLGAGFGAPSVEGDRVYVMDRIQGERDVLRCLDLDSGKELWQFAYDAPGNIDYEGSRSQPAVDEDHVYILGPFGHFQCIDKTTHEPVWSKRLTDDFKVGQPGWAFSQSPLLYKDVVIVAPIGKAAGVVAFNRATGDIAWQSPPLDGNMPYSSPVLATIGGTDQVLVCTTRGLSGVHAGDGSLLWSTGDWACRIPISSPYPVGGDRVFITGGYGAGAAMFRVSRNGDPFQVETLWKSDACKGQIQPPVLHENHLYLNGNDKGKAVGFMCLDLDGNVKWNTGTSPGFDWGGTLLADGLLYVVDGTAGDLCLVKPTPEAYTEIGRAHFLDGGQIWGHIVCADGRILLRDQSKLVCVDVTAR